jgi:hypothetical protein
LVADESGLATNVKAMRSGGTPAGSITAINAIIGTFTLKLERSGEPNHVCRRKLRRYYPAEKVGADKAI